MRTQMGEHCCQSDSLLHPLRVVSPDPTSSLWLPQVEMEGEPEPVWLHRKQLRGCDARLRGFVRRMRE